MELGLNSLRAVSGSLLDSDINFWLQNKYKLEWGTSFEMLLEMPTSHVECLDSSSSSASDSGFLLVDPGTQE